MSLVQQPEALTRAETGYYPSGATTRLLAALRIRRHPPRKPQGAGGDKPKNRNSKFLASKHAARHISTKENARNALYVVTLSAHPQG